MISGYKTVSIIYGGSGKKYADALNERIKEVAGEQRYPIQAAIINEKILTRELLTDVMGLFRQSEFCVVFLTEEDVCLTESGKKLAAETAMKVIDAENSVLSEWSRKDIESYLELSEKFNRELRAKWQELLPTERKEKKDEDTAF